MGNHTKDPETSLPIYAPHASPKPDSTLQGQDEPTLERASIAMLVVANMPRMAIQMAWASWWAAMGPALGAILTHESVWSIQIVGPLSGLVIGPIIGAFSDRSTNPWGRRRPFLLWGAIFNAIFLVVMGYTREIGEAFGDSGDGYYYQPTNTTATAILAVVFFTCMAITLNVVQTPAILLVADIAGDRQTVGAAIGICWSLVGNIVTIAYIEIVGSGALHEHYFLGFLAVVVLVTVGIVCAVVKEASPALSSTTGVLHSVVKMPSTLIVYGVLLMIVSYGNTLYQGYKSMFFALEVLSGQAEGSYFCEPDCTEAQNNYNRGMNLFDNARAVTYEAVSCVYYLILPLLAKKFGAKAVIVVAFVPQALLLIVTYIKVFIVAAMVDVVVSVFQSTAFVLLVPAIIHVFGKDVDIGACVGLLSGISGVGPIISVGVGAAMVETSMGFKLPVLLGGIFALVGIIVASVFLKLKMHVL